VWLAARSDQDPCMITPARFLELLYRRGEKIAVFTENYHIIPDAIWPKDVIPERGPNGIYYLAQPVDGEWHPNPRNLKDQCERCNEYRPRADDRLSAALRAKKKCACGGSFVAKIQMSKRSEEAVTSWRYFVIESDKANLKLWLAAIVQFPLRIAAIYSSGGRSVHALVKIDARTKTEWDTEREALKTALVVLGADAGAMTAVRLTRLPGCWRQRSLQKLLYINPDPPMRPICELAPRRDMLKPWLDWAHFGIADSDETNGAALTRALHYYAPVSEQCRQALKKVLREQAANK
jgi:hypothetical protein